DADHVVVKHARVDRSRMLRCKPDAFCGQAMAARHGLRSLQRLSRGESPGAGTWAIGSGVTMDKEVQSTSRMVRRQPRVIGRALIRQRDSARQWFVHDKALGIAENRAQNSCRLWRFERPVEITGEIG